jgi:hypothetical protein
MLFVKDSINLRRPNDSKRQNDCIHKLRPICDASGAFSVNLVQATDLTFKVSASEPTNIDPSTFSYICKA